MRRNYPSYDPDPDRRFADARSIARSMDYRPGNRPKPEARARNLLVRATSPETDRSVVTGEVSDKESSPVPDLDSNPDLDNDTVDTVQEHDRVSRTNGSDISLDHLQRPNGKLQRPEKNFETRTFENSIAKPKGDQDQAPKRRSSVRFWHRPFHKSLHRY